MLEIMIVLALVAVVMGGGIALMVFSDNQRDLRRMADEIEVMAKRARAVALLQQTPYAVEFTDGRVRMMPLVEAGMEVQDLPPVSVRLVQGDNWIEDVYHPLTAAVCDSAMSMK